MDKSIGRQNYEEVYFAWKSRENIKVIDSGSCSDGRCIIYCSGNGLWNPNDIAVFRKKILEGDYYEWSSWGGVIVKEAFLLEIY